MSTEVIAANRFLLCLMIVQLARCTIPNNPGGYHNLNKYHNSTMSCTYKKSRYLGVDIYEEPASVTSLVGTYALFYCAGAGDSLVWEVDGSPHHFQTVENREITANVTLPSPGTVQSTLTVPATSENNGTTVRCVVKSTSQSLVLSVFSNYSTLTVLPGESELTILS